MAEVHALVRGAGLAAVAFLEPWRYDPASYLSDAALLKRAGALALEERQALAEMIAGNLKVHVLYAVKAARAGRAAARPDTADMRPLLPRGAPKPWRGR